MAPHVSAPAHVLVIDIGKTNAKLVLVEAATMREIAMLARPSRVQPGPPYPHADTEGVWAFVLDGIRSLNRQCRIDAIVPTAHAAAAVLLDAAGQPVLPVLDYEHSGPEALRAEYDRVRPGFEETGSPRLPAGLNLGAQLYWQFATFPEAASLTARIVTYPQYWASRLCGVPSVEATSLGSHTDLWSPRERGFSSLVGAQGWTSRMAPLRRAGDRLGAVRPDIAAATGLEPDVGVCCGIHDSNASLLPHLLGRPAPFSVVSTGTWVIAMAIGGDPVTLDPARDTLINVNAFGDPVPSARFMGGREWEVAMRGRRTDVTETDVAAVLDGDIRLWPALAPGCGPFADKKAAWSVDEAALDDGVRAVAVSFYLAMMTATCLELIGARGPVLVEGPLTENAPYLRMLRAATGRPVAKAGEGATGTAAGAALLAMPAARPASPAREIDAGPAPHRLAAHAAAWRRALDSRTG